jgi:hypothetical protein
MGSSKIAYGYKNDNLWCNAYCCCSIREEEEEEEDRKRGGGGGVKNT